MRIKIKEVKALMVKAHAEGYEPVLTINGEFYSIDYNDKPQQSANACNRKAGINMAKAYLVALTAREMTIIKEMAWHEFNALDHGTEDHSSEQLKLNTIANKMLKLPKAPKVLIEVLNGVAECTERSEGVLVVIKDHDNASG